MQKIAFRYGLQMFAGFAGLFLVAHLLGLSTQYHLRILNGIIHLSFIYLAVRSFRRRFPENVGNYLPGVAVGIYTSVVGVVLFCIAMGLFLTYDQSFFLEIQSKMPMPEYFTPFTASLFIFAEGIVVSLIGSYLIVRVLDARSEGSHA
ncbi:MAG: hypothetical protein R2830_20270 [Saprospiraceae bacterium]